MSDDEGFTIETVRQLAQQAGLSLSGEELEEVMPGIARNRERAKVLEKWVSQTVEPATASLAGAEGQHGN